MSTSSSSRLTYFNGRGRGELIRLMLEVTGTPYTERTVTKTLLQELRERGHLLFQQLPLLEVGGLKLVQSGAIVRYLARKNDFYGSTDIEACRCDMIADGLWDLREHFISFSEYQKRQENRTSFDANVRDKLVPRYVSFMEGELERNKMEGRYFLVGNKLSYADVASLEVLELIDEEYPGLIKSSYPLVSAFHESLREVDRVKDYLRSGRRNPPLNDSYVREVKQILN